MEDLDNTQNIRFLRKHYIDPMTGKEEWRLLHMGPNGKLIDSKIKKADPNADQWHQGSITEFKSANSSPDDGDPLNANIATRKRPSDDQIQAPMQGTTPGTTTITDPAQLASAAAAGMTPGGALATVDPNAPKPPGWLNGGALPGMPPGQRNLTLPQSPAQTTAAANTNPNANPADQSSVSGNGGYGSSPSTMAVSPVRRHPPEGASPGRDHRPIPRRANPISSTTTTALANRALNPRPAT